MTTIDKVLGAVLAVGSAYGLYVHNSEPTPANDDNYTSAEASVFDPPAIELPNDGKTWVLIYATANKKGEMRPRAREVWNWLHGGNARLTEFKAQVKFYHFHDSEPRWKALRAKYTGPYPMVIVQDWSAGKRIYLPRDRLPRTSKELASTIRRKLRELQATDEKDLWQGASMLGQCPDGQCRPGRFLPRPWRWRPFRRPRPNDNDDDEDTDDAILPNIRPLNRNRDDPMRETGELIADRTGGAAIDPNLLYPGAALAGILGAYGLSRRKE